MKLLSFFITVVFLLNAALSTCQADKYSFCKSFSLVSDTSGSEPNETEVFTVDSRRNFILSSLCVYTRTTGQWTMSAGSNFSIGCHTKTDAYGTSTLYTFPEDTAIVDCNETLLMTWLSPYAGNYANIMVIGYFEDVLPHGCVSQPQADLNNDCIVNGLDFAILASQWMQNGITE